MHPNCWPAKRVPSRGHDCLLEKYLRHHALVFMAQQMTVKERHAPDDRVREVHHQIDASFDWNVHCIQPLWMREGSPIHGISEKVNLVDVKGVDLVRVIHHSPVVKGADGYTRHGRIRRTILLAVDVEPLLNPFLSSVKVTTKSEGLFSIRVIVVDDTGLYSGAGGRTEVLEIS